MIAVSLQPPAEIAATGFCRHCQQPHQLGAGNSRSHASQLMAHLQRYQSIAMTAEEQSNRQLSTASLFTSAGGKMFGVLECRDQSGQTQILRAFSGQYGAAFLVTGWAPPLFPATEYQRLARQADQQIKELDQQMAAAEQQAALFAALRAKRRAVSRHLMTDLHQLYRLRNFRGAECSIQEAWQGAGGIPTGAGDCCAPKLLQAAALAGWRPVGLCEFFWGASAAQAGRQHQGIYPACAEKCQPLLGFLLCGADQTGAGEPVRHD